MPFKDTLITEECIKEITNENLQKKKRKKIQLLHSPQLA